MKKNLLTATLCVALATVSLQGHAQNIFSGERVMVVGQFNGYATTPYGTDYRTTTYRRVSISSSSPVDGRGQWATTINVQNSGGDVAPINMPGGAGNGFLFISGPSANRFQNKWVFSGIGQGTVNGLNNISAFNSGNDMGLNMGTTGYYTFVFNDAGYTSVNARYYVGLTSAPPVDITPGGEIINPDGSATVNITTSAVPSPQEGIYVRYTLGSDFAGTGTSSVVEATGAGTSYTATIPTQASGTVVRYYIFSSTRSLAQLTANSEAERSLAVLRYADNSGANFVYTTTLLPVTITSFTARKTGPAVWLRCNTEAESNLVRYELLRSANGTDFELLQQTAALNSNGPVSYEWTDQRPLPGTSFYKVGVLERDGRRSYSTTVRITSTGKAQLSVYPNPVAEQLWVTLPNNLAGRYELRIINTAGQTVLRQAHTLNGGNRQLEVQLGQGMAPGRYSLVLDGEGNRWMGDFVVR
jgi:hypothetical protein